MNSSPSLMAGADRHADCDTSMSLQSHYCLIHSSCCIPYRGAVLSLSSGGLQLEWTYARSDPCCSLLYTEVLGICYILGKAGIWLAGGSPI